jgi:predicted PurR-regulated permease PerM
MDEPKAATHDRAARAIEAAQLRRQAIFWLLAALAFIGFLYLFRSILLPFVAGMILAYFLDPVADRLERFGLSRALATTLIVASFLVGFVIALMLVVPILVSQLAEFITRIPHYVTRLQFIVTDFDPDWLSRTLGVEPSSLREGLSGLLTQAAGFLTTLFQSLWNSGRALIDIAGLFVITPVVAFYMLLDWDRMVDRVDSLIPRDHLNTVRQIATDIDRSLAGFVRGQGTLCLVLGIYYALGLTLVGVNFGLLIGLFAGFVSFIPYVGAALGLVLAVGVALVQFWPEWHMILLVAGIFVVGQTIEGNILQPKLVGRSVGLHPVWLIFALFAFGLLFGFVGLLIAVPAAAAIGVLVRFALSRYLMSPLYTGGKTPPAEP